MLPNSSPTTPSVGYCAAIASIIARSTALSASVTGVLSGFVVISKSSAWYRESEIASARSARVKANASSAEYCESVGDRPLVELDMAPVYLYRYLLAQRRVLIFQLKK